LRSNPIPVFTGEGASPETLLHWANRVKSTANVARMTDDNEIINLAYTYFSPAVRDWFSRGIRTTHGFTIVPVDRYPFTWAQLQTSMMNEFAPAASTAGRIVDQILALRRSPGPAGANEYTARLLELLRLYGEANPHSIPDGHFAFSAFKSSLTPREAQALQSIYIGNAAPIVTLSTLIRIVRAHNDVAIAPGRSGGPWMAAGLAASTAPGPMELSASYARGDDEACLRCGGRGHWSPACPTPADSRTAHCQRCGGAGHASKDCSTPEGWRAGAPVARGDRGHARRRGRGSGGSGGNGTRNHSGRRSATANVAAARFEELTDISMKEDDQGAAGGSGGGF
jgi:hypothetical protein